MEVRAVGRGGTLGEGSRHDDRRGGRRLFARASGIELCVQSGRSASGGGEHARRGAGLGHVSDRFKGAGIEVDHAGLHVVGFDQDPPLLRGNLRAGLCAGWEVDRRMRHGADDGSDGGQREDDMAAVGLADGGATGSDPGRPAWVGVDGGGGMASGRAAFRDGRAPGARDVERGVVRGGGRRVGAFGGYEEADHARAVFEGWKAVDPGRGQWSTAAQGRGVAVVGTGAGV